MRRLRIPRKSERAILEWGKYCAKLERAAAKRESLPRVLEASDDLIFDADIKCGHVCPDHKQVFDRGRIPFEGSRDSAQNHLE